MINGDSQQKVDDNKAINLVMLITWIYILTFFLLWGLKGIGVL